MCALTIIKSENSDVIKERYQRKGRTLFVGFTMVLLFELNTKEFEYVNDVSQCN